MREIVKKRRDFSDVDLDKVAYIPYEPYLDVPKCTDFSDGKRAKIVLRNKNTGCLEEIYYRMSGGVPFDSQPGDYWFWGDVESKDANCCLVFCFNTDGTFDSACISFCGKEPSEKDYQRINNSVRYAAEFSTRGAF